MKKINKLFFMIAVCLLAIPCFANAVGNNNTPVGSVYNDTSVCKSGCTYSEFDDFLDSIAGGSGYYFVDVRDAYEYKIGNHNLPNVVLDIYSGTGSNINISGTSENIRLNIASLYVEDDSNVATIKNLTIYSSNDELCGSNSMGMCPVVTMETNSMIDNVTINGNQSGLSLVKGYTHTINKYTFGGPNYAVVLTGFDSISYPQRAVTITNSHLAGCDCSLVAYDGSTSATKFASGSSFSKRQIAFTAYNVKVDSSEVNCAKYGASDSSLASNPTIYFTSSNKWTKSINKGTEFNSNANIVEGFNSKIIIDLEKAKTIKLSSRDSIQSYFSELKSVNTEDISWRVADPSILKIENGKVIPLKVGTTQVTATYNNINYTVNFRITSIKGDINNPKTGLNAFLVIAIVIAGCALIYPVALQKAQ